MPDRVPFSKPALTATQQLDLMIQRGLTVEDRADAERHLQFIGYYRLSGYYRYFADTSDPKREKFLPGITFQRVLDLYIFDRHLRLLLSDALERIEVGVKACLSNTACLKGGPHWLCNSANFNYGQHSEIIEIMDEAAQASDDKQKHIFLKHFFDKYSDDRPPSWMLMEALPFGPVSRIYKLAKGEFRLPVAAAFGVQHDILESWLHALVFARNVCAHHNRIWNRTFTIKPKIPKRYSEEWPAEAQDKLYIVCCIIHHMMKVLADDAGWVARLKGLIAGRPQVPLKAMGFPEGWEAEPFWN